MLFLAAETAVLSHFITEPREITTTQFVYAKIVYIHR